MREKTCVFIGHGECYGVSLEQIEKELERLIDWGITDFLCGGMGRFDWMCAWAVYELKKYRKNIRCDLIIPYLTFRIPEFVYFDEILYPEGFEKYHFKAAILARNQYMVDHAAYALCYVTHRWGGAAKTYEKAVKQGLTMINLGNEELWKNYGTMQ